MKTLKISALALFSALSFAACDDVGGTGVTGLRQGQFEGDVSGVLDIGLSGEAVSSYAVREGVHDLIVLTDYTRNVQVVIYDTEGEFFEGRMPVEDEEDFDSRVLAYVEDLETGESFGSVSGTLDLVDVRGSSIEGSAIFTAESDDFPGEFITVDVVFRTEFDRDISFNLSPSLNRSEKR